jgi:hypothetical protein
MIKNSDLKTYQRTAERGNPTLTDGQTESKNWGPVSTRWCE